MYQAPAELGALELFRDKFFPVCSPKLLPKGTILRGVAHYDNSEENLANPDPNETVRYGDQTWEEMMHGFYDAMPVKPRR